MGVRLKVNPPNCSGTNAKRLVVLNEIDRGYLFAEVIGPVYL
jgi:hypothetical protein